jgi:RHS repeat-associated protein
VSQAATKGITPALVVEPGVLLSLGIPWANEPCTATADPKLIENSYLGFEVPKPAPQQAFRPVNSNVTSGIAACLRWEGGGSRCTGKERDPESGLDYFGARYFSASQGRFTSPDEWAGGIADPFTGGQVGQPGPLPYADITDPQTLNKYVYVRNNPLRYTDPDGHEDQDEEDKKRRAAQGAAISVGTQATQDAAVRANYVEAVSQLNPGEAAARTAIKIQARAATSLTGQVIAETMRPIADETSRIGGTVANTNQAVNSAMGVAGKAGPVLMVAGVAISAYNVATAGNPSRTLAQEGGAWAGALSLGAAGGAGGAWVGAAIGAPFGGVGAVPGAAVGGFVGAVGGGIVGAVSGSRAATYIYDWLRR